MPLDIAKISELNNVNVKATTQHFPAETSAVNQLIDLYCTFTEALGSTVPENKLVEYELFWISLRGLFCSSELIFSAHIAESYSMTSRSLEAAGYANHIRISPVKSKIWLLKRHDTEGFKKAFSPRWVGRETDKIKDAYNLTREYGTHSNFSSTIFSRITVDKNHHQNIFSDINDLPNLHRSILYTIHCYILILEIIELCFKDLLNIEWKDKFKLFRNQHIERISQFRTSSPKVAL